MKRPDHGSPVPPVRYPLALADCWRAVFGAPKPGLDGAFVTSGAAALAIALRGARALGPGTGREVVVPDFICPSVLAAVRAAGLTPRCCAIDPATWFYGPGDLVAAIGPETAAVVVVAYFGFPPQIDPSERQRVAEVLASVPVVEDFAQAFGIDGAGQRYQAAEYRAGFRVFSFARGKSLPMAWGGLVVGHGHAEQRWLATEHSRWARKGLLASVLNLLLSQLQSLVLHPAVWRFVPLPRDLTAESTTDLGQRAMSWPATRYPTVARSLPREIAVRRRNARRLAGALADLPGLLLPAAAALAKGAPTVALRLPVIFDDAEAADTARKALYGRIIKGPNDYDDYDSGSANAASICRCLITLPTFSGSERAGQAAIEAIRRSLGESSEGQSRLV